MPNTDEYNTGKDGPAANHPHTNAITTIIHTYLPEMMMQNATVAVTHGAGIAI